MDIFFSPSPSPSQSGGDNISSNYSEITSSTYLFHGSDSQSPSSSSSSDSVHSPESISSSHTANINTFFSSDEENVIILASDRPKKRSGRTKFKETRHPVYRGIRKRNNDKWVCEVREPNTKTRIWLGTYSNPEMAARAHDVAAIALRGKSACLNFADSVWRLPVPVSSNAKDIRKAATEAAKAFADDDQQQRHQHSEVEVLLSMKKLDKLLRAPEKVVFDIDELDAEFDMPRLLADMAEGLLLSPPCYSMGKGMNWDDKEYTTDMYLWNY